MKVYRRVGHDVALVFTNAYDETLSIVVRHGCVEALSTSSTGKTEVCISGGIVVKVNETIEEITETMGWTLSD